MGVAVPGTGLFCPGFDASVATEGTAVVAVSTVVAVVTVVAGTGVDLYVKKNKCNVS